jgi:hypothetical protein
MSERLSVIGVSCFEIARRDANVYFLFLVVGSAGCHFGFVYDALGKQPATQPQAFISLKITRTASKTIQSAA